MPIKGVYSWTESSDQLLISIHLKGVSPKKVDIFCTENILKVNYSPYIVDILLYSAIDPLKNKAKVKEGILNITLFKRDSIKWGILENQNEGNESQRVESIRNHEILEKELSEKRKDKKIEEERHSLRKQMALDESEKNRIENLKSDEKKTAEAEVYQVLSKFHSSNDGQNASISSSTNKSTKISNKSINSKEFSNLNLSDKYFENGDEEDLGDATNIFVPEKSSRKQEEEEDEEEKEEEEEEEDIKYIPPPREAFGMSSAKYDINFTPRIFPTPVRESKLVEEEDWIAKNRRHLKKHAVYGKNIGNSFEDEDPSWLKAKGDDFFRSGDFRSAINAYTSVLDVDDSNISCYSNRAICYLKINLPSDCKADCSAGIEKILNLQNENHKNDIEISNKSILVKLFLRRGVVNTQLGLFSESLSDYESALNYFNTFKSQSAEHQSFLESTISQNDIISDIDRLKLIVSAEGLKKQADELFCEKKIDEAILKYSEALDCVSCHVSCLSNRSACYFAIGNFEACIQDCTLAINLLEIKNNSQLTIQDKQSHLTMMKAVLPEIGSEKRKSWILKTFTRRGAAYIQLKDIDKAINDYGQAVSIDNENEALKSDLNKLNSMKISLK